MHLQSEDFSRRKTGAYLKQFVGTLLILIQGIPSKHCDTWNQCLGYVYNREIALDLYQGDLKKNAIPGDKSE
jgi:hypothetical protein